MSGETRRKPIIGWLLIAAFITGAVSLAALPLLSNQQVRSTHEESVDLSQRLEQRLSAIPARLNPSDIQETSGFDQARFDQQSQRRLSDLLRSTVGDFREIRNLPQNRPSLHGSLWRVEFETTALKWTELLERLSRETGLFIESYQIRPVRNDGLSVSMSVIFLSGDEPGKRPAVPSMAEFKARNPFDPERQSVGSERRAVVNPRLEPKLLGLRRSGDEWVALLQFGPDDADAITARQGESFEGYDVSEISSGRVILNHQNGDAITLQSPFSNN